MRLEALRDLERGHLTTQAAAQLLGLERRQVFQLLPSVVPVSKGVPARRRNGSYLEALLRAVLAIIREWYWVLQ